MNARSVLQCGSPLPILNSNGHPTTLERAKGLAHSKTWRCIVVLILLLATSIVAYAQGYSIDWFTIDCGGGTSTGGAYSLSGTIGQPDAGGSMTGGNYSLTGGFWSLYAVQTPGAPLLRIFLTSTNTAVVAWPAPSTGFTLQQNTNLLIAAGWVNATNTVNVVGSENQITVSPPTGNRYYRLHLP